MDVKKIALRGMEAALGPFKCKKFVQQGMFGAVERACLKRHGACSENHCVALKVALPAAGGLAAQYRETLVHESNMLYSIWSAAVKQGDREIQQHMVQPYASMTSTEAPWLLTEYVRGSTVKDIKRMPTREAHELYVQTLAVLLRIRGLMPQFVHGDLHAGNLFLVDRPAEHRECLFSSVTYDENGEPSFLEQRFRGPRIVRLIDFGLSESSTLKYLQHPSGPSLNDRWAMDALMALDAFQRVAEEPKALRAFCLDALGPAALAYLDQADGDAFRAVPGDSTPPDLETFLQLATARLLPE